MSIKRIAIFIVLIVLSFTNSVAYADWDMPTPAQPEVPPLPSARFGRMAAQELPPVDPTPDETLSAQAIALGKPVTFGFKKTYGETGVPYLDSSEHLNDVSGITQDGDGNVYVVEISGQRLLKYSAAGVLLWKTGKAGKPVRSASGLFWPGDVAVRNSSEVWVAESGGVARFSTDTGALIRRDPVDPAFAEPEFLFSNLSGIAFDSAGRVYLSDQGNQRIRVYDLSGDNMVYRATIGTSFDAGTDSDHFNYPGQIEIDATDALYVADTENSRIQRCTPDGAYLAWSCGMFAGTGTPGIAFNQLNRPRGLDIGADGAIYIADSDNDRIVKCEDDSLGGSTCAVLISDVEWPADVSVHPVSGDLLVAASGEYTVKHYTPAGVFVRNFAGTPGVPYLTDTLHYNRPQGLDVDPSGNLYVGETAGHRLIKISSTGAVVWAKGVAGVGTVGLGTGGVTSPAVLAVDPTGKKIAVIHGGTIIRIYSTSSGAYLSELTRDEDNYRFDYAAGLAYDRAGNLYVSDQWDQVVRVYNKYGVYLRQLGETNVSGPDDAHFSYPAGLATDVSNNLYVADSGNCRVQKFNNKGVYLMTIGTTRCGSRYDQMQPMDVAVDSSRNVYVSESNNNRISVYSTIGSYLGYVGGIAGTGSGAFINPTSIALDSSRNLYVADGENDRVQRFVPFVTNAAKISQDGFGATTDNAGYALSTFKGKLYSGTSNYTTGAQIWRQTTSGWEMVMGDGFEDETNVTIDYLYEYKGYLYASTVNCSDPTCAASNGGQLWRSPDGLTWRPIVLDGFGDPNNAEIFRLTKLGANLCASTWNMVDGGEIWCSPNGDAGTWTSAITPGFGSAVNFAVIAMQEYNGVSYASTAGMGAPGLYRKTATEDWAAVPFPTEDVFFVSDMAVFRANLFVITQGAGATSRILRCKVCDGTDWMRVDSGFGGSPTAMVMPALELAGTRLYAVVGDPVRGLSIWKTTDGTNWSQLSTNGLGSSRNLYVYYGNGVTAIGSAMYLNVIYENHTSGAVWKVCTGIACR